MSAQCERPVDPLIDEVRRKRQQLVEKHGGLKGWVRHLQELDKKRRPPRRRAQRGGKA